MKARLIALLILVILIGIPALAYWFFFQKNISSVSVFVGSGVTTEAKLSGTFSQSFLPLADRALNFQLTCHEVCEFTRIPPANYTLEISGENIVTATETFALKNRENLVKNFRLTSSAGFDTIDIPAQMTADEKTLREADVHTALGNNYSLIARDIRGRLWVTKTENSTTSVGIFMGDRFVSVRDFPYGFTGVDFDYFNGIFAFSLAWNSKILMSLDGQNILETTLPEQTHGYRFDNNTWYAITDTGTLQLRNNAWEKNIRFSHFVDSDHYRLGYIRAEDTHLLSLGNYDANLGSVILVLDRSNGKISEIARGRNIDRIFAYEGSLVFAENNNFYQVHLP